MTQTLKSAQRQRRKLLTARTYIERDLLKAQRRADWLSAQPEHEGPYIQALMQQPYQYWLASIQAADCRCDACLRLILAGIDALLDVQQVRAA